MAMPRKGRREIVIDGKIYYYSVKKAYRQGRITIQARDGSFWSGYHASFTPSQVKAIILKHLQ